MNEFIVDMATAITQYGCLIVYVLALALGFTNLILWLAGKLIKNTIGMRDFYQGFIGYLRMKRERDNV